MPRFTMVKSENLAITVIPASTKTGYAVIEALLQDSRQPKVRGYYGDLEKVPGEFLASPNFKVAEGDVCDRSTLDFEGADAVLAMTPPREDGEDMEEHARISSQNIRYAVLNTKSVKRLVYLSSVGAQFDTGVGEIKANHIAEKILSDASFETIYIRPAYLMENFLPTVRLLLSLTPSTSATSPPHIPTPLPPTNWTIPMVSTADVAQAAKHVLTARFSGAGRRREKPLVLELHGPRAYGADDVARALSLAKGEKVDLDPVPPERLAEYFVSQLRLPVNLVPEVVEMTRSFLPGGRMAEEASGWRDVDEQAVRRGDRELVDVVRGLWDTEVGA